MIRFAKILADYESRPIGLTSPPRLSWWVTCDGAYIQQSYRIRIGTDSSLSEPLVLDTGDVLCRENHHDCRGMTLRPFTRYFWQVGVRNEHTGEFVWSEIGEFVTSALRRSQWKTGVFFQAHSINVLMKRRTFTLSRMPEKAYLFVASSGEKSNGYHLTLNGINMTADHILPGPLEYISMQVNGFDVTDLLREKNVLNLDHITRISCVLKLFYPDGTSETIESDNSWRVFDKECFVVGYDRGDPSTVPEMQHGKCERFDRRLCPDGWYDVDFDDSAYPASGTWWGPLTIDYCGVKSFAHETVAPRTIAQTPDGILVDFGTQQAGYARITLHNCTEMVTIRYAEILENGKIKNTNGYHYQALCEYIPRGDENEVYTPRFMHTSFRYILIEGLSYSPAPEDLRAVFICSDVDGTSSLHTSSADINYMNSCIRRSYLSNLLNIPTDCPGRERRGWTADAYVVADSQIRMYDVYNLYARWLGNLKDCQRIGGWCPVEYPDRTDPCVDLNWPMHLALTPWDLYRHTGNRRILEDNLASMEAYAELLDSLTDEDLFAENLYCYGDHVSLEPAGKRFLGAVVYCAYLKAAAAIENALGRTQQQETYLRRQQAVRAAINREFLHVTQDAVWYDNDTQSANIMALAMGVCPDEYQPRLLAHLICDITTRSKLTFGMFGSCTLYKVLSDNGCIDLAWRLLTDHSIDGSSLLRQITEVQDGTLCESYEFPWSSHNHMFLGSGAARWFFEHLAGINPTTPGYRTYEIRPYIPQTLDRMHIDMQTPQGVIALSWEKSGGKLDVCVNAPWNADGTLYLNGRSLPLAQGENRFTF